MPRFTIYEERTEIYSAIIEARDIAHALELYDKDEEAVFGDQWEHEETLSTEIRTVNTTDPEGHGTTYILEDGQVIDEIIATPINPNPEQET